MIKIKTIYFLTGLLLLASCNKKLDLAPENTLVEQEVFKTEAGAEQALNEAYYDFLEAESDGFSYAFGDFTTRNLINSPTYNSYDLGGATPSDYSAKNAWINFFKSINSANNVIAKIPLYGKFSGTKEKQFIAEAKFIRAFSYLNLLQLFGEGSLSGNMSGPGLPLQLTPFEGYNTGEIIPRSTNGEVYAQIVKDLQEALVDLPQKQADDTKTRSRATIGCANALLARTYLYMGQFDEAASAAKNVLNLVPSVYSLTNNLLSLFPFNPNGGSINFTPEIIFGLPVSQMVSPSVNSNNGIGSVYYYKRYYWIDSNFTNSFEPGDLRISQLIWKGDSVYNSNNLKDKTTFKFNNSFGMDNVPMIRLAEVMLTRSEALARTSGINQESIDLLNQIRNRSLPNAIPFTTGDFPTQESLIQEILLQRRFELAFEGFYRYDLLRTGQPLSVPDIPDNKKVLPIPQVEIDISNGLIKQNSGY